MRLFHFEVPRGFSTTVKTFRVGLLHGLASRGITYEQHDLNPSFWSWLLEDCIFPAQDGLLNSLFNANIKAHLRIRQTEKALDLLRAKGDALNIKIDFGGLKLPTKVNQSTLRIYFYAAKLRKNGLEKYFYSILEAVNFKNGDFVSFGIDSPEALVLATSFAQFIKERYDISHVLLARHNYENFSLVRRLPEIAKNNALFLAYDAIIEFDEHLDTACVAWCDTCCEKESDLHNIALRDGDKILYYPPPLRIIGESVSDDTPQDVPEYYFTEHGIPVGNLCYQETMVRNKCYFSKCTFCVQIDKHLVSNNYENESEIKRILKALKSAKNSGIEHIMLMDEAIRPKDVSVFCDLLEEAELSINWFGRFIAGSLPNLLLLQKMKRVGCKEILFGLETISPRVANLMGKVSKYRTASEIASNLDSVYISGIGIYLSMIYDFPSETVEEANENILFCKSCKERNPHLVVFFNKFVLYENTEIYRNPEKFGIEIPPKDTKADLNFPRYVMKQDLLSDNKIKAGKYKALILGVNEEQLTAIQRSGKIDVAEAILVQAYGSLGLQSRVSGNQDIVAASIREIFGQS